MSEKKIIEHKTVLLNETIDSLNIQRIKDKSSQDPFVIVDCTAGYGGHLGLLLSRLKEYKNFRYKIIAIDQDQEAINFLSEKFKEEIEQNKLHLVEDKFSNLSYILEDLEVNQIDGLYADLGVSTHQILSSKRGFSFINDGPLDMRMGDGPLRAYDIVNAYPKEELVRIIKDYGGEPKAFFITEAIVKHRQKAPIETTKQLESIVVSSLHYKTKSKINPATRTFMALRIAVNDELEEVKNLIDSGFKYLKLGSRMSIISFHSLEDTIVKKRFMDLTGKTKYDSLPRDVLLNQKQMDAFIEKKGQIIKPFPIIPSSEEIELNPRSRSAKLRVIEKTV